MDIDYGEHSFGNEFCLPCMQFYNVISLAYMEKFGEYISTYPMDFNDQFEQLYGFPVQCQYERVSQYWTLCFKDQDDMLAFRLMVT